MVNLNLYYVTSPSLNITALAEAPDTYQARTLLLDYLEKERVISRNQRNIYRKQILTKKVEYSPDISTDLYLSYIPGEPQLKPMDTVLDMEPQDGSTQVIPEQSQVPIIEQTNMSPLSKVALTGKV